MAVTKRSFKGRVEERGWQPGKGGYADPGPDAQAMIKGMTGAQATQSGTSKGLPSQGGPGNDHVPPRHNYSLPGADGAIGGANNASTGAAGAVPDTAAGSSPSVTGAGGGSKIVKTYGSGGVGGPSGLTKGGGALGRNTGS